MKILHVIDSGGFYGAEAMLLDLMIGQKYLGALPVLCSIGTPDCSDKEIELRTRNAGLEVKLIRMRPGLNLHGAWKILQYARTTNVDIFHAHGYKGYILLASIPKSIRNIPLTRTIHGWTNTDNFSKLAAYEWLDRLMLKQADAIIVVNNLLLNDRRLISANIKTERLFVINNGIDLNNSSDSIDKDDYIFSFTNNGFIIGSIGRLSSEKGHIYLLEAVKILATNGYDIKLVVIGDGDLMHELANRSKLLNIDDRVLFSGYKNNAKSYLNLFDVFVISSLTEGLPITLLEAMQAEIPVVATAVGGIPDVLKDRESGLLVPPANPDALAHAIMDIINTPKSALVYAKNAVSILKNKYSVVHMIKSYMDMYKSVI